MKKLSNLIQYVVVFTIFLTGRIRKTQTGREEYIEGGKIAGEYSKILCDPLEKQYNQDLIFTIKANMDSLKLISSTELDLGVQSVIKELSSNFSSKELDAAIILYQIYLLENNRGLFVERIQQLV